MNPTLWLDKTALRWSAANAVCSPTYWDRRVHHLDQTWLKAPSDGNQDIRDEESDRVSISYRTLVWVTAFCVQALRRMICQQIAKAATNLVSNEKLAEKMGIPIAVAIPEGPLLPLAVLAVHVLNEPFTLNSADTLRHAIFAILVPMDPSDGKERLRHMIQDTQPAIILCDSVNENRIKIAMGDSSAAAMTWLTGRATTTTTLGKTELVDFSDVVQSAVERYFEHTESPLLMNLMSIDETNQKNLVDLVSALERLIDAGGSTDHEVSVHVNKENRISHIVYTSGTTGKSKGCVCSIQALRNYLAAKNEAHAVTSASTVLLASSISFDPCFSDVLATFAVHGTLAIAPRRSLMESLWHVLASLEVSHILCTPTLWSMVSLHMVDNSQNELPCLQVIALGGEPIPKRIVQKWARTKDTPSICFPRLLATYGVTEACVYQTCGEVFQTENTALTGSRKGQVVGNPMKGSWFDIESESVDEHRGIGEVVLSGLQVDELSGYLNQPELSGLKFVSKHERAGSVGQLPSNQEPQYRCYYKTGDSGYIDAENNFLHILGRIDGEDGMIKVNGVRVELGEIEAAIVDTESSHSVITACVVVAESIGPEEEKATKRIVAYCVLSPKCFKEMDVHFNNEADTVKGLQCSAGPLLAMLRARCEDRLKKGCIPSSFIVISRIPLSATGKRDRRKLPKLAHCRPMEERIGEASVPLREYGTSGAVVAHCVTSCLNLQPCQKTILMSTSSFRMLGGDSLGAIRIVRSLYAYHHRIPESRHLGGARGIFEGPFAVTHMLRAETIGDYVDWLDRNSVCQPRDDLVGTEVSRLGVKSSSQSRVEQYPGMTAASMACSTAYGETEKDEYSHDLWLYEALLEATTRGYSSIAVALLDLGVNPNLANHGGRLSRADRTHRKLHFHSTPLHVACAQGNCELTSKLLEKKCKLNSPDASGSFPIHLACSGNLLNGDMEEVRTSCETRDSEDLRRIACVKHLIEAGAPLFMKDGNKQSLLHCAARSGHCELLAFLTQTWSQALKDNAGPHRSRQNSQKEDSPFDWRDHWFRTPVHWAVLNGKVEALRVLLKNGCSANPPKPKRASIRSSIEVESPLEICNRLYGDTGIGNEMRLALQGSMKTTEQ